MSGIGTGVGVGCGEPCVGGVSDEPGSGVDNLLLEDGGDHFLLEDGTTDVLLLEA